MKKIISTTLLLAAAVIPAFGQTETPSYETTLHLQIRPADELYGVTGVRPYYKYDMWYVRDVLTEETFAMLRPVAESPLEISGKISFYGYADLPDLKGERVVSTILLGNNEEGGSLKFNFNEDFISSHGGMHIAKVNFGYVESPFSAEAQPLEVNGVVTMVEPGVTKTLSVEIPDQPGASSLSIAATGLGIGFDTLELQLKDIPTSVVDITDSMKPTVIARYAADGRLLPAEDSAVGSSSSNSAKGLVIERLSDGSVRRILR